MAAVTEIPKDLRLLVDADILLYRCGFAAEKQKYLVEMEWEGHKKFKEFDSHKEAKALSEEHGVVWTRRVVEPVENALHNVDNAIRGICEALWTQGNPKKPTGFINYYLTGKGNFRDSLATTKTYKDNRDPSHRPKHYRAIKEHLIKKFGAEVINGEEADDAIGRAAYSLYHDKYVIVSNDKDLDQLAGFHYNWITKEGYFVTDEEAVKNFYVQLLAGDSTDNIPGVIGATKARTLIEACSDPHECALCVKANYQTEHGEYWADKVEEVSELVWIRRHVPAPDEHLHSPFWNHYHG